jgi:hypothetical protein
LNAGVAGALPVALTAYAVAGLVHHAHNAEFLADYPGMPAWLSHAGVYWAWAVATAFGALGYVLVRRGRVLAGCSLVALYAAYGFDSLAHYALAPPSGHTAAMNLTIGLEAATAALLLAALIAHGVRMKLDLRQ